MNMRNATQADVDAYHATGIFPEDVIFSALPLEWQKDVPWISRENYLYHVKKVAPNLKEILNESIGSYLTVENVEGYVTAIGKDCVHPVLRKGPATSPRKQRTKPKSGDKPFKFNMDDLAVGDVVKTRRKGLATIVSIDPRPYNVFEIKNEHDEYYALYKENGREYKPHIPQRSDWDVVGYHSVAKLNKVEVSVTTPKLELKKNVWYPNFFSEDGVLPEDFKSKKVQYATRYDLDRAHVGANLLSTDLARDLYWEDRGTAGTIAAFKIVD
jgi:hypothetical protein